MGAPPLDGAIAKGGKTRDARPQSRASRTLHVKRRHHACASAKIPGNPLQSLLSRPIQVAKTCQIRSVCKELRDRISLSRRAPDGASFHHAQAAVADGAVPDSAVWRVARGTGA